MPITAAQVEANGWVLRVTLTGSPGTFAAYNLDPSGTPRLVLTSSHAGFVKSGGTAVAGMIVRATAGMVPLRQPVNPLSPTLKVIDETDLGGGQVRVRIALAETIYAGDAALALATLAGWRTGESAQSGIAVTNSSTVTAPVPVLRWMLPPYEVTTGVFRLSLLVGAVHPIGFEPAASGIRETREAGAKSSGAATAYSYSASFAIALAGRPIAAVGRIWADGRLMRDAAGDFLAPATMRLHRGTEGQAVDPLIAAAEGAAGAPAYRGIAYAVFEDLPLADYGNRIPNLTFEIIADPGDGLDAGAAIAALAMAEGRPLVAVTGGFPAIDGSIANRSGSVADAIAPLLDLAGASLCDAGGLVVCGSGGTAVLIAERDTQARAPGDARGRDQQQRTGDATAVGAVEVAFYDTSRDYQPGLQRARRGDGGSVDQQSIAAAMSPAAAKTIATTLLARSQAGRLRTNVRLPWRHVGLRPGALVRLADDGAVWRIRELRFEAFIVHLDLERVEAAAPPVAMTADGGRAARFDDAAAGPTTLHVLDLPALPGEAPTGPRLLLAAAGASPGWRRAAIVVSADAGASYAAAGVADGATMLGATATALGGGPTDRWDRAGAVEVELLAEAMWLQGCNDAAVLAGGNLALIGAELVQFGIAEALAPRRFRLSRLLRGRRGTEAAIAGHAIGERFVLLGPSPLAFAAPPDAIGRAFRFRAAGAGDAAATPFDIVAAGRALRPLSPVHLRLAPSGGDVDATWVRRSRTGFGWNDFVDAPLGEASEAYRIDVALGGRPVRQLVVGEPRYRYAQGDRLADGGGGAVTITVAQLSQSVGPGDPATATVTIS